MKKCPPSSAEALGEDEPSRAVGQSAGTGAEAATRVCTGRGPMLVLDGRAGGAGGGGGGGGGLPTAWDQLQPPPVSSRRQPRSLPPAHMHRSPAGGSPLTAPLRSPGRLSASPLAELPCPDSKPARSQPARGWSGSI
ncbi:hypothetical protein NDU88_010329 [Pleurodeles waltl]|uniref:Uncharacterized protein n=1 Tax=Pleurodeles waltl TaxID=8319 RepID=A0AAV7S2C6_PLEWA|nr:hypothetical protein NDU88_010329 [Pleurodeles waltl]